MIEFPSVDGCRWSVFVQDIDAGEVLLSHEPDLTLSTASIGKLFLLHRLVLDAEEGRLFLTDTIERLPSDRIGGSGFWQLMTQDALSIHDLALFVAATSDNDATNALLRVVGIERVREHARALGFQHTSLNDAIRYPRQPHHPERLSQGNARELARFVAMISNGEGLTEVSRDLLVGWLGAGCDMSMVAQPFHFDPPDHNWYDRGVWLWNKTGTIGSVRADVGVAMNRTRRFAYAVLAEWNVGADPRDEVHGTMAEVGLLLQRELSE